MGRTDAKKNHAAIARHALIILIMTICACWIEGYSIGTGEWGPQDSELLKKLATLKKPGERARMAEANRNVITKQWLYSAASHASTLESNYADDTGLRMTRVIEEIAITRNLKECRGGGALRPG